MTRDLGTGAPVLDSRLQALLCSGELSWNALSTPMVPGTYQDGIAICGGGCPEPGQWSMWIPFPTSSLWGCFWLSTLNVGLINCSRECQYSHLYISPRPMGPSSIRLGCQNGVDALILEDSLRQQKWSHPSFILCCPQLSPSPSAGT